MKTYTGRIGNRPLLVVKGLVLRDFSDSLRVSLDGFNGIPSEISLLSSVKSGSPARTASNEVGFYDEGIKIN